MEKKPRGRENITKKLLKNPDCVKDCFKEGDESQPGDLSCFRAALLHIYDFTIKWIVLPQGLVCVFYSIRLDY